MSKNKMILKIWILTVIIFLLGSNIYVYAGGGGRRHNDDGSTVSFYEDGTIIKIENIVGTSFNEVTTKIETKIKEYGYKGDLVSKENDTLAVSGVKKFNVGWIDNNGNEYKASIHENGVKDPDLLPNGQWSPAYISSYEGEVTIEKVKKLNGIVSPSTDETNGFNSLDEIINFGKNFISKGENKLSLLDMKDVSNNIYNLLLIIGIFLAVAVGMFLGIKFMVSSAEDKAKVKEALVPYIVGCVVIFGAFIIWKLAITLLGGIA